MQAWDFADLWQAALQSYHDPLFIPLVVGSTLLSAAAFLCFALPWTLLAFIDPIKLRRFKIQQKPFQVRTYFWPNIARITINSSIMLSLMVLAWPLFRELNTIHVGELPAWYWRGPVCTNKTGLLSAKNPSGKALRVWPNGLSKRTATQHGGFLTITLRAEASFPH